MNIIRTVLILFFTGLITAHLHAATYYVSAPLGNDANTGTTLDKPKKTIQGAINAAAAGDTIELLTGTYAGGIKMNKENLMLTVRAENSAIINTRGSSASVIDISADGCKIKVPDPTATLYIDDPYPIQGGERYIYYVGIYGSNGPDNIEITGAPITGPSFARRNFQIRGPSNYLQIRPTRAQSYVFEGIKMKGDNCLIQGVEIFYMTHMAISCEGNATNIKIFDNYLHDVFYDPIRFGAKDGMENTYHHKTLIERNVMVGSYISDGFQTNEANLTEGVSDNTAHVIRNNIIGDCAEQALDLKGAQYVLIEGNWIYRGQGDNDGPVDGIYGPGNGCIICGSNQKGRDIIVRKNVVVDMAGAITGAWQLSRVAEYHNTSLNAAYDHRGSNQTLPYNDGAIVFFPLTLPGAISANKNNIGVNGALYSLFAYNPGSFNYICDYNLYFNPDYRNGEIRFVQKEPDYRTFTLSQWRTTYGLDINSKVGDPLLNLPNYLPTGNPYGKDFSLKAGSPARDAGDWLCTVTAVSGNTLSLSDSGYLYFYDGFGIATELPDMVYDDDGNNSRLVSIDRTNNKITLQSASGFTAGDGLTTINYTGSRPDIGAFEYSETSMTPPSAPGGLTVK